MRKSVFFLLLISLFVPQIAQAQSAPPYFYLDQDPTKQVVGNQPWGNVREIHSFHKWYEWSIFYPGSSWNSYRTLRWRAMNSTARPYFVDALAQWQTVDNDYDVDWHPWLEDTSSPQSEINLALTFGVCSGLPSTWEGGCVIFWNFSFYSPNNFARWKNANMYVRWGARANTTYPDTVKRAIISHEIGHLYGLHERHYMNPTTCNQNEGSVMDSLWYDGNVAKQCDNIETPMTVDKNRYETYYLGGQYNHVYHVGSGGVITSHWKDRTWSDWSLRMKYYKLSGNVYNYVGYIGHLQNIGGHQDVIDLTIIAGNGQNTPPQSPYQYWGAGTYMGCAVGWNGTTDAGVEKLGNGQCFSGVVNP